MAKFTDRVYWDACTWIALIQREKIETAGGVTEDRESACKLVLQLAEIGKLDIVTSFLTYAEVCKRPDTRASSPDNLAAFFEHDYILSMPVDRVIGENARTLMMSCIPGLKPPDAIHVASAALANVFEMHTFDDRLLRISRTVQRQDGKPLVITKPRVHLPPAPLLEVAGER